MAQQNSEKNNSLIGGLGSFFNGESTLKIAVGLDAESMFKLAIVAIVTTLICMTIHQAMK